MSYTRTLSVDFGRSRSGLSTVAWSLTGGSTWFTTGVVESPAGSGIYEATLTLPDAGAKLRWKTGEGGATERFAAEDIAEVRLDLTQPLADVKTATIGGALHGSWAAAFGKMVLDRATKVLSLFGWNSQSTALQTFDLDSGTTPVTRTPS